MNSSSYRPAKGLFFKSEDVTGIRERINAPEYQALWNNIKATADRACEEKGILFSDDTFTIWYYVRNRLMDLGLVCMVTEEEKYVEALSCILRDLSTRDMNFWQGPEYPNRPRTRNYHGREILAGELETAQLAMGISTAFDWAYPLLNEETKRIVIDNLKQKGQMLLRNSTLFQSEHWVMNHLCVIASALVLTTLILEDEGIPFEEDITLAQKGLNLWMKKIEADGSYGEAFHYWAYPMNCLFFGVYSLKNAKNIDMEGTKWVERAFEWAIYNQVGKHEVEGYDRPVAVAVNAYDCPYLMQMEAPEVLLYANYFNNPLAQWYTRSFLMDNPPRPDSLHKVWHVNNSILLALHDPRLPERSPQSLDLPMARIFHDTGFVYFRDSWDKCDKTGGDTVLELQSGGGGRSRSHEHYDKNSFSLYAKGEYFIVDPGHSCYRGKPHHDYDTRTRSHNTVTINGQDQSLGFVERGMLHDEARNYTSYNNRAEIAGRGFHDQIYFVASDARKCYEPYLKEFIRSVWFVKPDYFVIWDRVDIGDQPGGIQNGFNINNYDGKMEYSIEGNSLMISRPKADLSIQYVSPLKINYEIGDGRLHLAYHIFPDATVEGKECSTKRFTPVVGETPLKASDFVYVICPLDKGEKGPKLTILETRYQSNKPYVFESIRLQVEFKGNKDVFQFDSGKVSYSRENGACYVF